jgi:hypothetical protein
MILLLLTFVFVLGILLAVFFTNATIKTVGLFFGLVLAAYDSFQAGTVWRGLLLLVPAAVIAYFMVPFFWVLAQIVGIWLQ